MIVPTGVHLGAHRTATTSLQRFLWANQDVLQRSNIATICPPVTRGLKPLDAVRQLIDLHASSAAEGIIVSDENLLGVMKQNIQSGCLYPAARSKLEDLRSIVAPDVIMLSIRELGDYWTSCILFRLQSGGLAMPTRKQLAAITSSLRLWHHVLQDILETFPQTRLVVREFNHKIDNPKRFLMAATRWSVWSETRLNRKPNNMRPSREKTVAVLTKAVDAAAISRLGPTEDTILFSKEERAEMLDRYQQDLVEVRKLIGKDFLE